MKRYYVSEYVTDKADNEFVMPYNSVHIGVATDYHVSASNMSFDNGYVNLYNSLPDAWAACKKVCQLQTLVLNDNLSDDDVKYISDDINKTSSLFNFKCSDNDNSLFCKKQAYIDIMSKKAMCRLNRLDVDFTQSPAYKRYTAYKDILDELDADDLSGSDRSAVFEDQAMNQKKYSTMFSRDRLSLIIDPCINKEQSDFARDELYKNIAESYGQAYVSLSEIDEAQLNDFEQILDEAGNVTSVRLYHFIRNGKNYDINVDVSKSNSVRMQIAMYLSDQLNFENEVSDEKASSSKSVRETDLLEDIHGSSFKQFDGQFDL